MKKQITILALVFFLILSGHFVFENSFKGDNREWHLIGEYGPFYIYNGTRYPYEDIHSIFLTEENERFELDFKISFKGYSEKLIINVSNSNNYDDLFPYSVANKSGYYHIIDLVIEPEPFGGDYPYDVYKCNLTFWGVNDSYGKLMFNYLNTNASSTGWSLTIKGEWNQLFLTFERNSEIIYYNILFTVGTLLLVSCTVILLIFIAFRHLIEVKTVLKIIKNISYFLVVTILSLAFISMSIEFFIFQVYNYLDSPFIFRLILIWIANIIVGIGLFLDEKLDY